jgi:YegS/Rv2252/BmrU family lipid kinase
MKIPYRDVLLVANPIAGRGRGASAAREIQRTLEASGAHCRLELTRCKGDGARIVRERAPSTDLVLAVGGDGTVADVLEALPPELPLAVRSMGTANVMAHDLMLPREPQAVLAMLARGRTTGLDVAEVNGRVSFLVTGVGIDGAIVRCIDEGRCGPISKWSYVRPILHTLLGWRPPSLAVHLDGARVEGEWAWVLVSNIIGYGGFMRLSPERVLDDGLYEVFLFPRGSRLALLGYGLRGVLRHLPGGDCRMLRAREVRIESREPAHYQVDGDYGGITPVTVRVTGRRNRLCIP